jgi:hypothetical protein
MASIRDIGRRYAVDEKAIRKHARVRGLVRTEVRSGPRQGPRRSAVESASVRTADLPPPIPFIIQVETNPSPATHPLQYWIDRWYTVFEQMHDAREALSSEIWDFDKLPTAARLYAIQRWAIDSGAAAAQIAGNIWQLLGALEALNGILLFGLTTAFMFAMIQQVWPLGSRIR